MKYTNIPKPLSIEESFSHPKSILKNGKGISPTENPPSLTRIDSNEEISHQRVFPEYENNSYKREESLKTVFNEWQSDENQNPNIMNSSDQNPKQSLSKKKSSNPSNQEVVQVMMEFTEVRTLIYFRKQI